MREDRRYVSGLQLWRWCRWSFPDERPGFTVAGQPFTAINHAALRLRLAKARK
jgi:hypothetical protein